MIVRDETDVYIGIKCDRCAAMAPPAREIMEGNGLNNMGWHCWGGTHLCPEHAPRELKE